MVWITLDIGHGSAVVVTPYLTQVMEPATMAPRLSEALQGTTAMAAAGFSVGEAEGLRRAMSRKRSSEAIEAFRKALNTDNKSLQIQARMGVIKTALRLGEFLEAQKEAATLKQQDPKSADVIAMHADALWSAGLFDEAAEEFKDALAVSADLDRIAAGQRDGGRRQFCPDRHLKPLHWLAGPVHQRNHRAGFEHAGRVQIPGILGHPGRQLRVRCPPDQLQPHLQQPVPSLRLR